MYVFWHLLSQAGLSDDPIFSSLHVEALLTEGCSQVVSPNMFNMQLWETSGHAANYKENMFTFEVCHIFLNVHGVSN